MKITKIINNNSEAILLLEDNASIKIPYEVFYKYSFKEEDNLDNKQLKSLKDDINYFNAYKESLSYLNKKMYSIKLLEQKLSINYNKKTVNKVISSLIKNKLLSDETYIKTYLSLNISKYGPLMIKEKLLEKLLDENLINECIDNIDKKTWLNEFLKYNNISFNNIDNKAINKLYRYGFSENDIVLLGVDYE